MSLMSRYNRKKQQDQEPQEPVAVIEAAIKELIWRRDEINATIQNLEKIAQQMREESN